MKFRIIFLIAISMLISSCKNNSVEWYEGGTLHKSKISDWKNATEKNKLATCADFCIKKYSDNSFDEIKIIAINLRACINEVTKDNNYSDNLTVAELASMCLTLMEN